MTGRELARLFYFEVVSNLVSVPHSACLLGEGSDVLGYDDARSTDHEWGPRVQIFTGPGDVEATLRDIGRGLPREFHGFETRWFSLASGAIDHHVKVTTFDEWIVRQLSVDPRTELDAATWLGLSQQQLLQVTEGSVFRDDLGDLARTRRLLARHPDGVRFWMLASEWRLIGNLQPLLGRSIEISDILGARLLIAKLCQRAMEMAFLLERRYWPYDKWFGTVFARLKSLKTLGPMLERALAPDSISTQYAGILEALTFVAHLHNILGATPAIEPAIGEFQVNINDAVRPYQVLNAGDFVQACRNAIADKGLRELATVGSIDQLTHADDLLVNVTTWPKHLMSVYRQMLREIDCHSG